MNRTKILLSAAVLYFGILEAQQSRYFNDREDFRFSLAQNLYETKIYNASQYEYARQYFYNTYLSKSRKEISQFFDNVIGVILQKNGAEKGLSAFMNEYPNSAYFGQASMPLVDYYLAQKDFQKASEILEKINPNHLSKEEETNYVIKLGYTQFMLGDSASAIETLQKAYQNLDKDRRGEVAYMLGHLYYAEEKNNLAFQYFDSIKNEEKYAHLVRPYYVQMYFNDKKYNEAISEGKDMLSYNISEEYKAEVNKIIGESYFMQENYQEAYPYLKKYLDIQNAPSESDLYEMGFVSAQLGKYDEAVGYYNQLVNNQSKLSQNAYYQLGNAYLQTQKKQEALSAYRSAYQMSYDAEVKQLAHEQYAKLSYDIGNPFEAAPAVIQAYIDQYPRSNKTPEMKTLLVKSYLYSGNYKGTLEAIDKLSNSTKETDKIDQEVSFLLGTEEFNKANYDDAEHYFSRSLEIQQNKEITPRATYWLGQTYYQKGNYPSAIARYESIVNEQFPEKVQLNYDLGYAHFKAKNFAKAKQYFREYLKNPNPEFKTDAELRLADTHYADNELNEAIAIYDKTDTAQDYTLFQKAMALGFKGDNSSKIRDLKKLTSQYPNSDYVDDALYEIGVAYASEDDFSNANDYFTKAIKNSTDKDLIANAQLYKVQNLIAQNQEDKALSELKILGNQYKNTSYAGKLVQVARPIFAKRGDIAGYEAFAKNVGVSIEASDREEIHLSTARNFYAKKDYKSAITHFEKYLAQNPTGEGRYQAQYELGESYYQTKNNTKALLVLREVADNHNDYQEDAQTRVAQILLLENKKENAIPYLESIVNSSDVNIRNYASLELMKLYAEKKDFKKAEKYADLVLTNSKNSTAIIEMAKVVKARTLMNEGKDKDAQKAYALLEKSSNTEVAAEALYAKAYYQNKAKAYKSSNETIFKLANNYASEEYWGAKALLVLAQNYIGLKDKYQATYTIDQVLENYKDFPEIIQEAKQIKKNIK